MWSSMSDSDQVEAFQQLQSEEKHMRKDNTLTTHAQHLQGASVSHTTSLLGLMGQLHEAYNESQTELKERILTLQAQGSTPEQINAQLRHEYLNSVKGQ